MPETRTTKAASTQGADSAGSELVTMATLRELLKVQERMFRNLFDSLLANVNARLDSVIGQVAEIKARLFPRKTPASRRRALSSPRKISRT